MGGSGKTQLALECCRKAEANPKFTTVIWIDASSPDSVEQNYKSVATKLAGTGDSNFDIEKHIAIVEETLRQRQARWLAVFDNFDDPRAFQTRNIQHYIPTAENGSILFTSRNASSERLGHVIQVSGMSEEESLDLLLQRRQDGPLLDAAERCQGLKIATELGYLALALDQAGAYIRARNLPLQEFVSHYRGRKRLILQEIPGQWEYRKSMNDTESETLLSAFTTWELSFEQLGGSKEVRISKEHFLTLAAFFDSRAISQRYFEAYCKSEVKEWMQIFMTNGQWNQFIFGDVVAECRQLSLLQAGDQRSGEAQFSLHPVIQDWLKVRKDLETQRVYAEEATNLLTRYLKEVDFNELNLQMRQEILSHIDTCLQNNQTLAGLCASALEYQTSSVIVCMVLLLGWTVRRGRRAVQAKARRY